MRIAMLRMNNFLCFKGEHILHLEDKVYAVVARHVHDSERSNWLGKSAALEAIDLSLYGRHRKRTEDGWITDGEKAGAVEQVLDDGTKILRSRVRGKRTSLTVTTSEGKSLKDDEAQLYIDRILGLTKEDFLNTSYFRQREMASLVLADPGESTKMISSWCQLGPLESCRSRVRDEGGVLADKLRDIDAKVAVLTPATERKVDQEDVALALEAVEKRRGEIGLLRDTVERNAVAMSAKSRIDDYNSLVAEGKKLRAEVDALGLESLEVNRAAAEKEWSSETARAGTAQKELKEKRQLLHGKFDGRCPVAGIDCPAKSQINDRQEENAVLFATAEARFEKVEKAVDRTFRNYQAAVAASQEADRKAGLLASLRTRVQKMMPEFEAAKAAGEPEDALLLRQRVDLAQDRLSEAERNWAIIGSAYKAAKEAEGSIAELLNERTEVEAKLALTREAAVVFQAAHRKVAEGVLAEIEAGANDSLRECAIDLQVEARWSREGDGLAKSCDACGAPFPASTKVKACARCAAVRGPHIVNKLEFVLSDKSGAAEDLAGALFRLSASEWLRRSRGSQWNVGLFDELFGQLDKSHRRAFASHLSTMLRGSYGFEQAFVVAHSPDVLDALPGRIVITSLGGYAKIEVVA